MPIVQTAPAMPTSADCADHANFADYADHADCAEYANCADCLSKCALPFLKVELSPRHVTVQLSFPTGRNDVEWKPFLQ